MSLALRPYVTAGVALVGASVIAVTPVAPPAPALQTHAVELSAAVQDPISQWVGIANRTFTQSGAIVQSIVENPAPILQQIAVNQLGYAQQLGAGLQTVANIVSAKLDPNSPYGILQTLITAGNLLQQGDAAAASQIIWQNLFQSTLFSLFPVMGLTQIPGNMAQNFANAVKAVGGLALPLGVSVFGMLHAPFVAFEETATDFSAALANQDTAGAALALASFPGKVFDYTVNGIPFNGVGYQGLIGAGGLIPNLVAAGETIAKAIAPKIVEAPSDDRATAPAEAVSADRAAAPVEAPPAIESSAPTADAIVSKLKLSEQPTTEATTEQATIETTNPSIRESVVAVPGKTSTLGATNKPAAKVASDVRDGISATFNKIGESVKKAFAKPEKKSAAASTGSDKGAGAGNSGDAK